MPQLGIPATIVAYITLQQITNLNTLVVNSDNINSLASDDLELSAPNDSAVPGASYVEVKKFKINYTGIHRVKFLLFGESGGLVYGRIYKNGSGYGTERTTALATPVLFTEDLSFTKGDFVSLYIHNQAAINARATSFAIYGTVAFGSVLLDNQISGGAIGYVPSTEVGGG